MYDIYSHKKMNTKLATSKNSLASACKNVRVSKLPPAQLCWRGHKKNWNYKYPGLVALQRNSAHTLVFICAHVRDFSLGISRWALRTCANDGGFLSDPNWSRRN